MTNTVEIPEQLRIPGMKFLKVVKKTKLPSENSWQDTNNYDFNSPVLLAHLVNGGNYGVLPRDGVSVIDIDNAEYFQDNEIIEAFKDTLKVRTGSGGMHLYIRNSDYKGRIAMYSIETGDHVGDFFSSGCPNFVVGPGSTHPNGDKYTVSVDRQIKEYPQLYLEKHLFEKIKMKAKTEITKKDIVLQNNETITSKYQLRIQDWITPDNPHIEGEEIIGAHPIHGSKGGHNFSINPSKNVAYCFRDSVGGDPLYWIAVKFGYINCGDILTNEAMIKCVDFLKEHGYRDMTLPAPEKITEEENKKIATLKNPVFSTTLEEDNFIQRYIRSKQMRSDSYIDYQFGGAISILSACIQRNASISLSADTFYPNIWSFFIGSSSVSRKTTAVKYARESLNQDLIKQKLFSNEFSPEGFISELSEKPQTFIFVDEASGFLANMRKMYMTGMKEKLCEVYDNGNFTRRLKKEQYTIENIYMTMCMATTPTSLKTTADIENLGSGWFYRYLWFYPNIPKQTKKLTMETAEMKLEEIELKKSVQEYWDFFSNRNENKISIEFPPEVLSIYTDWVETKEMEYQEKDDSIGSMFARIQPYALKLSSLFSIGKKGALAEMDRNNTLVVSKVYMKEAIRLIEDYFLPMVQIISGIIENANLQCNFGKVEDIFLQSGGKISRSDLAAKARFKNVKELDDVLNQMINIIGCVIEKQVETSTRPKIMYYYQKVS
jgi:hypothetical protein